jgi:DNA-binding beta-propeller fold protein YncE
MKKIFFLLAIAPITIFSQELTLDEIVANGKAVFDQPGSCATCHGSSGEGIIGPQLTFGPSPLEIRFQGESNPYMTAAWANLNPSDEDIVAIAMYIRTLGGLPVETNLRTEWLSQIETARTMQGPSIEFAKTARDLEVERVERFSDLAANWERRSKEGSLKRDYDARVVERFEPGEPKFTPEPGKTYFYENVGTNPSPIILWDGYTSPKSNQVVVGDAETMEVIASYEFPEDLRATVHTSAVSPDGSEVYITGPRERGPDGLPDPSGSQTMVVADALTLQPTKLVTVGARLHHGQVFGDYMLFDMFARDADGPGLMIYDPKTEDVLAALYDVDLGGMIYTTWADPDYEYIYALMEPAGYAPGRASGMRAVTQIYQGTLMTMRPFWVAKINATTWEVELEFPVPGFRPNWALIDNEKEFIYTITSTSNISKIDLNTGVVEWTNGTGIGPYGVSFNADESEIWIADKGEGASHLGRTITIIDVHEGHAVASLYGGYKVDHVLLSPNGKEMWATSNGEGRLYVYDADSRELLKVIDMPQNGDAHGLIWVHYDESGQAMVVRDQGNFHNGINPIEGVALNY